MAGGIAGERNQSRRKKREAAVWQRRYWEHTIRDDTDFAMHFNYILFQSGKTWPRDQGHTIGKGQAFIVI